MSMAETEKIQTVQGKFTFFWYAFRGKFGQFYKILGDIIFSPKMLWFWNFFSFFRWI